MVMEGQQDTGPAMHHPGVSLVIWVPLPPIVHVAVTEATSELSVTWTLIVDTLGVLAGHDSQSSSSSQTAPGLVAT